MLGGILRLLLKAVRRVWDAAGNSARRDRLRNERLLREVNEPNQFKRRSSLR